MLILQIPKSERPATTNSAALAGGKSLPQQPRPESGPELDRMVRGLAGRLHARLPRGCGIDMSDLVQAGNVGLLQAASNYDPRKGAPLAGFAKFRIRGEMLDMVRRQTGRDRCAPPTTRLDKEGDDWESRIPATDSSPQDWLVRRQRTQIIGEELRRLPARDRTVVRLRYIREMTLQQIGTALRVNESRASQIHRSALNRLKRALSNRGVRALAQL